MNEELKTILYQAIGYSFAMFLGIGIITFLQRGFLFKFVKVKASMGKLVLLRVRQVSHWDYFVGKWDEGDLIFGGKNKKKRINNITSKDIYRSLGINWLDLDGKKWAILSPASMEAIEGFDPEKQESLVTRALYKPPIDDVQDKIIMIMIVAAILAGAVSAYFGYNILNEVSALRIAFDSMKGGLVVPT